MYQKTVTLDNSGPFLIACFRYRGTKSDVPVPARKQVSDPNAPLHGDLQA